MCPPTNRSVSDLATVAAASNVKSAVLTAALETIFQDKAVCCGQDSAPRDLTSSSPSSLRDLSGKLQGKHVLGDGQIVVVSADYVSQSSINPDLLISSLREQHARLTEWRAHFWVLYGVVFDKTVYASGCTPLAEVRHEMVVKPPKSFKISSGCREVCTTF